MTTDEVNHSPVGETSHRAARSAAVRGIAEILGKVATLAWTVAAARNLSLSDFGTVSYAMTIMLVLSSLAAWGFDSGLIRRGSAEPDSLPRLYQGSQVWKTVIGVPVFLVAGLALSGRPSVGDWVILACMLLAGFPELWSATARSVASARQVSVEISTALVLQRVVTAVAIIGALAAGFGADGVAIGFLAGTLVGWQAHRIVLRRMGVRQPVLELRREDLADAISGTFLIGLSGLVLMLLFRVDVLVLGHLRGPDDVAVYSVAYRLLETVLFVTYAINQAVLPVMSATEWPERRRKAYQRALSVAAFVYLPFVVVSLVEGRAVIDLLFGAQYADEAAPVLAWLAPAPLLLAAAFFGTSLLVSLGRSRALLLSSTVALVANVVLNFVLIPPYGASGAAASTSVAYAVQMVVILVALRLVHERPSVVVPLLSALGASVVLAGVLLVVGLPLLLELAVGAVIYLGSWLLLVRRLAPEEQAVVVGLLRRRPGGVAQD